MNVEEILNIDVKNLQDTQYEVLKEHTIDKLKTIILWLEDDELQMVANQLSFSPAGDDMGLDNYFIDFSYNDTDMDLSDILIKMAELKNEKIKLRRCYCERNGSKKSDSFRIYCRIFKSIRT